MKAANSINKCLPCKDSVKGALAQEWLFSASIDLDCSNILFSFLAIVLHTEKG